MGLDSKTLGISRCCGWVFLARLNLAPEKPIPRRPDLRVGLRDIAATLCSLNVLLRRLHGALRFGWDAVGTSPCAPGVRIAASNRKYLSGGYGKSQTVCKPGSVPAGQGMAIHLGHPLPDASRDRPGRRPENMPFTAPIWSCSRWGLPCRPRRRGRGALLPHPFTLTRRVRTLGRAVCFLWHFP